MNSSDIIDYYELLGIPSNATVGEIHKAYWHGASRSHPDRGGSHEEMVRLAEAWKILSNPERRSRYDQLFKNRQDDWRSTKFNKDVVDARKRAKDDASRSWAEFEEIYQKAVYIFNQDFYGEDLIGKAAGPYSPLMGSNSTTGKSRDTAGHQPTASGAGASGSALISNMLKIIVLVAVLVTAFLFYRTYGGAGRYIPLNRQEGTHIQMLDTTNGAVYTIEKQADKPAPAWRKTVPPVESGDR